MTRLVRTPHAHMLEVTLDRDPDCFWWQARAMVSLGAEPEVTWLEVRLPHGTWIPADDFSGDLDEHRDWAVELATDLAGADDDDGLGLDWDDHHGDLDAKGYWDDQDEDLGAL